MHLRKIERKIARSAKRAKTDFDTLNLEHAWRNHLEHAWRNLWQNLSERACVTADRDDYAPRPVLTRYWSSHIDSSSGEANASGSPALLQNGEYVRILERQFSGQLSRWYSFG